MNPKKVLFVCLGNICRSPAAEAVMNDLIEKNNLTEKIKVDSAGIIAYHEGEKADSRMINAAEERGYKVTSIARKFNPQKDFDEFDYIITMDDENFEELNSLDSRSKFKNKIYKMISFLNQYEVNEVPDPYYGGRNSFDFVLDLLEDATKGLLKKIEEDDTR